MDRGAGRKLLLEALAVCDPTELMIRRIKICGSADTGGAIESSYLRRSVFFVCKIFAFEVCWVVEVAAFVNPFLIQFRRLVDLKGYLAPHQSPQFLTC
jgi:hypothetical protein